MFAIKLPNGNVSFVHRFMRNVDNWFVVKSKGGEEEIVVVPSRALYLPSTWPAYAALRISGKEFFDVLHEADFDSRTDGRADFFTEGGPIEVTPYEGDLWDMPD